MNKIIDLSGEWNFILDEACEGVEKGFWRSESDNLYNDRIMLPGTTAQAGKGNLNNKWEEGFLTEKYPVKGCAWYRKYIDIGELAGSTGHEGDKELTGEAHLFLERTRITRVWINDEEINIAACYGELSSSDSLVAPHIYNLTEALRSYVRGKITDPESDIENNESQICITIMVTNIGYPTGGGHLTSPDTQTNWLGICGRIELRLYPEIYIRSIFAKGDIHTGELMLKLTTVNCTEDTESAQPEIYMEDGCGEDIRIDSDAVLDIEPGIHEYEVSCGISEFKLWSEYEHNVYKLKVRFQGDTAYLSTGFRELSHDGLDMKVNGHKIFLRGKHDGMVFPLTGAAPCDVEGWLRVMGIAKEYGINHYRFHTCCPPDAAFEAADILGIYMSPELPFWGTINHPDELREELESLKTLKDFEDNVQRSDTEGSEENVDAADAQKKGERILEIERQLREQEFLVAEGYRMMEWFGNHPSYCMMSLGNELWGSDRRLNEIMADFRKRDDRHFYVQGSNNFQFVPRIQPEDDYFDGARLGIGRLIRGSTAMCDAPLGFVQTDVPSANHSYDDIIRPKTGQSGADDEGEDSGDHIIEIQYGTGVARVKADETGGGMLIPDVPVVGHEIGQYNIYPNPDEIPKYTGVLEARNLQIFLERLENAGLGDRAEDYFRNSGLFAVECYKQELEAAHRSKYMSGYQILDIQDFPGQGTALVGILDSLMDSKGLVTPEEWRGFSSDTVLLGDFGSFIYEEGSIFHSGVKLSYFDFSKELCGAKIRCTLSRIMDVAGARDEVISEKVLLIPDDSYGLIDAGEFETILPESQDGEPYELEFALELFLNGAESSQSRNHYRLYVYPSNYGFTDDNEIQISSEKGIYINGIRFCTSIDEIRDSKERTVIYLPPETEDGIKGTYCTDFWNYHMFRIISENMGKPVPVGTMGLLIEKNHPALRHFPSETYTTPQWYHLIEGASLAEVNDEECHVLVRMIDNVERNKSLALLYETEMFGKKVLVSASNLLGNIEKPEVSAFVRSITEYLGNIDR